MNQGKIFLYFFLIEVIATVLQCNPSTPLRVLFYIRSLSGAEMNLTFAITSNTENYMVYYFISQPEVARNKSRAFKDEKYARIKKIYTESSVFSKLINDYVYKKGL